MLVTYLDPGEVTERWPQALGGCRGAAMGALRLEVREFLSWRSRNNPTRNHEVVGSIPGLAAWVKDHATRIWCCCGSGVGRQQQLGFDP